MAESATRSRVVFATVNRACRFLVTVVSNAGYRLLGRWLLRAAALAHTTLFALVPVSALGFSMFGVFGVRVEDARAMLGTVLGQVLPAEANNGMVRLQEELLRHLELFSTNVQALNTVSIAVLVFTSIALLNTIESALNVVWRTTSALGILSKITSFWAVLTLGPLLIALSIYLTSAMGNYEVAERSSLLWLLFVSYGLPVCVSWLALTLLFFKLPAARVELPDALLGAFIAAILFELVKRGFTYYVGLSASYSTIYGVVASIPLFLFWLYVTWCVVLFGAEVSYQSGSIDLLSSLRLYKTDLGETGVLLGLRVLTIMGQRHHDGIGPASEGEIAIESGCDPVLVRSCLEVLSEAELVSNPDDKTRTRTLVIAPDRITVGRIVHAFQSTDDHSAPPPSAAAGPLLLETLRLASRRPAGDRPITEWTLSDLLAGRDPGSA